MFGAGLVEGLDMQVERRAGRVEFVALRRPRLETAVEHAFALPILVVVVLTFVLRAELLAAVGNATLVKGVFGAVVEARNRGGEVKEG